MKIQEITLFKISEKMYDIYFNDNNIGYIKTVNHEWHWVFEHPINFKTYNGFDRFIKDAADNMSKKFFNISVNIHMKNKQQMEHLQSLHLLPIIEDD